MSNVKLRFAPSPTGYLHIGGLRTALYGYLYAKRLGGKYVLRIEDTDQSRLVGDATEKLIDILETTGITFDEGPVIKDGKIVEVGENGPYVQSKRLEIYKKYIDQLVESGHAYHCFCSKERLDELREIQKATGKVPKYDGKCRSLTQEEIDEKIANGESYVIRMKLPADKEFVFEDLVRGKVSFNSNDVDDQVLMKSDGFPTYHMAVVVDDHLMGITHAVRGEEWLSSTPKQLFLYEALGWEPTTFVHLPTVLNKDRKKLSKRQGDVATEDFLAKGYLKEGLINYLALVGWSPEDNQEIFDMDELIQAFDFSRVSKSGGIFDLDKLNWVNAQHIRKADIGYITDLVMPYLAKADFYVEKDRSWVEMVVDAVRGNVNVIAEIPALMKMFYVEGVELENDEAKEMIKLDHVKELLAVFKAKVNEAESIDDEFAKSVFKSVQTETGIKGKNLYMCTRVALTGCCHGPEMVEILKILGKEGIISKIDFTTNNLI
ncbi:MAG: glutamate--tRNA ligase [Clostridia bacterium]|nr:glutamate--tRNA ligase [Clostridia bacterium]